MQVVVPTPRPPEPAARPMDPTSTQAVYADIRTVRVDQLSAEARRSYERAVRSERRWWMVVRVGAVLTGLALIWVLTDVLALVP